MTGNAFDIGEGITLTKVQPEDAGELFALVVKNRGHLRDWMPWAETTTDVADTLEFVKRSQQQDADGRGFQCCIRAGNKIIGMVGHVDVNQTDRRTEIGYWIAQDYEGRGIVTRAVRTLVTHAFSELNLNRVEIQAGESNPRSRAIPERLGFKLEGTIREGEWVIDHYVSLAVYGLLRSEWPTDCSIER